MEFNDVWNATIEGRADYTTMAAVRDMCCQICDGDGRARDYREHKGFTYVAHRDNERLTTIVRAHYKGTYFSSYVEIDHFDDPEGRHDALNALARELCACAGCGGSGWGGGEP